MQIFYIIITIYKYEVLNLHIYAIKVDYMLLNNILFHFHLHIKYVKNFLLDFKVYDF